MSIARNGLASMGRRVCRSIVVAIVLMCVGCTAAPGPLGKLSLPFGRNSKEQLLRKQVETDSFPTAKQAGL